METYSSSLVWSSLCINLLFTLAFYKSCTLVGINGVKESDIKHWTREEGSD